MLRKTGHFSGKTVCFLLLGLVVGSLFSNFRTADYLHVSVDLRPGSPPRPVVLREHAGRRVVAISLKNHLPQSDLELVAANGEIRSWLPPVLPLPFTRWPQFAGGSIRGMQFGRRLPLYLIMDGRDGCAELEIRNPADGALLQTVHFMRGEGATGGGHH